jgi:hypothetical protein
MEMRRSLVESIPGLLKIVQIRALDILLIIIRSCAEAVFQGALMSVGSCEKQTLG